jgi:hypothetical protein
MVKKFKITNLPVDIDLNQYGEELHKTMQVFTISMLKRWLNTIPSNVPIWSGASRASFLKLAVLARTSIPLYPVVAPNPPGNRTHLGVLTSKGKVFMQKGGLLGRSRYGWEWGSKLDWIGIVDARHNFIEKANASIRGRQPVLPQPKLKRKKRI